jgi:outer membrane protein OmpA-like peptidoglycan-associated protein
MTPMRAPIIVLATVLLASAPAQAATTLVDPAARITDEAIQADQQGIAAVQGRIQALNDAGRPLGDYHMAKAQCWLDTAFHEYSRNDRSDWPEAALQESARLVSTLEGGAEPSGETPLVAGAKRLREDLWTRASELKAHEGYRCARAMVACFEVGLVHAGHEYAQYGWRHARSYIEMAEDQAIEATRAADECSERERLAQQAALAAQSPAAVPTDASAVAPVPVPLSPPAEKLLLQADALFAFDRHALEDMSAEGRERLAELARRLAEAYSRVDLVLVTGHTDRLGADDYNQRLSVERANTVLRYLESLGVTSRMVAVGRASAEPLSECGPDLGPRDALIECLAPDRRVEVEIHGVQR